MSNVIVINRHNLSILIKVSDLIFIQIKHYLSFIFEKHLNNFIAQKEYHCMRRLNKTFNKSYGIVVSHYIVFQLLYMHSTILNMRIVFDQVFGELFHYLNFLLKLLREIIETINNLRLSRLL
jgi:hypothetical protein